MKNATWITLAVLLFANASFGAGYTGAATVTKIGSMGANGAFEIVGSWANVDSCTNPEKFVVGTHSTDTPQTQNVKYSLLLAAHMSGQTVELYVEGCNSANQPIVKGIWTPSR